MTMIGESAVRHTEIILSVVPPYAAGFLLLAGIAFVIAHVLQKRRLDQIMVGRVEKLFARRGGAFEQLNGEQTRLEK
jgi:hypothetical protein